MVMGRRQHVSEAEYQRLRRDYADATEQFGAANEVLTALGRPSFDPDAVLHTVIETARRLCRCQAAQIYLIDGDQFVVAASVGLSREFLNHFSKHPIQRDRGTLVGRVAGSPGAADP